MALDVLLLFRNETPRLIKFQALGADANHEPVVKLHTAKADAQGEGFC